MLYKKINQMGKASKFKKIRKLASSLPAINTKAMLGIRLKGSDLINEGLLTLGTHEIKEDIIPENDYKSVKQIEVPLNHNKKMKQAYQKYGMNGVNQYVNSIFQFVNMHQPK